MTDSPPQPGPEPTDSSEAGPVARGRNLFETHLRALPRERRAELARTATGDTLEALCFDSDPGTVVAVLDNPGAGLEHARLVAAHHRNPVGLEALSRHVALARDAEVQRRLLKNPQTSETIRKRLLAHRRLLQLHPLLLSRELTERARRAVREAFRQSFVRAEAEEQVRLIVSTEGRCLAGLVGLPLQGKAAALLSRTSIVSSLLVQNLAAFAPTPPNVLEHLLRQPLVQRAPHLRQAVQRHPNCPPRLKRG